VWWKCPKGPDHEWESAFATRALYGGECPFCLNRRISTTNSLAVRYPRLAREWHRGKNGKLRPAHVVPGSHEKYWWRCRQGHSWQASLQNRARLGQGCPFCSRRRATLKTSLAGEAPALARQWHATKNGSLRPRDVLPGSEKKVWWKCPKGPDHEWQASCNSRTNRNSGCPFCAGRRVSVTNSLAARFPSIARQWHSAKNGSLTPHDVVPGTSRKIWWKCVSGHTWQAACSSRTSAGRGCPHCRPRRHHVATTRKRLRIVRLPEYEGSKHSLRALVRLRAADGNGAEHPPPPDPTHRWNPRCASTSP
jgi:hypothetical protein